MDKDRRIEAGRLPEINEIVEKFAVILSRPERSRDVSIQALRDRLRLAEASLLIEKLKSDFLNADRELIDRQRLNDIRTDLWSAASFHGATKAIITDRCDSVPGYDAMSKLWKSDLDIAEIALVDKSRNRQEELLAGIRLLVTPQEPVSA